MKRTLIASVTITVLAGLVLAAATSPVSGASVDLKARVSSILERFPAETTDARNALAAEILELGPAAVVETCGRVLPPGAGDDARARFAVNGLAVYVTRPGAEPERILFVGSVLAALAGKPDKQVAAFLISQVQLAGKAESVKPLARFLTDKDLAGPAAAAVRTIGGPEAAKALLKALSRAPDPVKIALIDALGAMRSRAAVKALLGEAVSADGSLRRAARSALANIGDPAAMGILSNVFVAVPFTERAQAPRDLLLFTRRQMEAGRKNEGLFTARALVSSYRQPGESQVAAEALGLIATALGKKALPDILLAVDSRESGLRGAALEIAAGIAWDDSTLSQWISKAGASGPEVRAGIVEMLGRSRQMRAASFIIDRLRDPDKIVRLAAIRSTPRVDSTQFLRLLGAADEEEASALKAELLQFKAESVVPEAALLIDSTPHPGKAVLIDVLGEKGARGEIDRVFGLAADAEPATRTAALGALAKLAEEKDLPRLADMLEKATDGDDVVRLQEAVVAAVRRHADLETRADALLGLLKGAGPARKTAVLRVLPRVGGAGALRAVVEETGSADSQVQSVAVYALSQWPDYEAAGELLRIASSTRTKKHLLLAVEGYVRLVGQASLPNVEKFSLLQGLLGVPMDDADRKAVLTGVSEIREPESLRLLAGYLDNPVLGETAAAGLLELAAEQAPQERWLSGHEAYSALRRVEARAADPAEKERVAGIILARLRQGGFTPLFDGHTLDGWKGLVADPPARAKMAPQELVKAQAEADERMRANWKSVDGVLVFDGKGESLCSARDYADFELLVDWKIEKGGDSGIYLRGSPQVQIWDAGANPVGSGGLYNNQKGKSLPLEKADRPVGEWNSFRIVMIGERVSVHLNDKLVVDNTILENYWERDKPIYPSGQVELQAHGNPLYFKNLFIREIPRDSAVPELDPSEAAEGFAPLFNGRDLAGWTGGGGGYAAEDGKIVVHPERGGGNLYTEKEFSDFVLRFEFKLTPAANNGLGVRAPLEGDAAYAGMELQILEDGSPVYWTLKPYQYHGSVYGVVPAKRGVLRPAGEWNSEEVIVEGRRVKVAVNGTIVVDADVDRAAAEGTMDGREHPGLARASGHIGFLGHGSVVEFRRIRVKELK
jgi:HEAT repeat protein